MFQSLQEFDFYKKVHKDLYQTSTIGGLFSTCAVISVALLFFLELNAYMTIHHMSQIILDTAGYEPFVSIRFNMTFPHLPCKYVSAELQDVYGHHTLNESTSSNVDVRIFKWRVVDEGKRRVSVMEEHKEPEEPGHHEILPDDHHIHKMEQTTTNLTVATFDEFIRKYDVVMVDFYAPWCIWCQRLAPVWENTAYEASKKDYADFVRFAKVDCTTKEWAPICRKKKIFAYPSVFLYRDGRSDRHQQYHGARTTTAFLSYIEDLPVETEQQEQMLDEEQLVREEIEQEELGKAGAADRHAKTADNLPIDHGINHPLKGMISSGRKDKHGLKALMSILNILANNGGKRQGGTIRILRAKNGGSVRIISIRRIPFGKRHKMKGMILKKTGVANRPRKIPIKNVLKNDPNVKIKILPNNNKKGGSKADKPTPTTAEVLKKATAAAVVEEKVKESKENVKLAAKAAGGKPKRRRRLMSVGSDGSRLSTQELRELKDEFLNEKDTSKRQAIWKKKVLALDDDLQKRFQDMLDGKEGNENEKEDEPKLVAEHAGHSHDDDGSRHDVGDIDGRAPEDHPHYVGHTEGCLIYGAVAAEKVPGTLRITAKSKWHDFVGHHIDLSHTIHHLSFGDLTHVLQNEFEHIDFHEYEGLKYISTLGGKYFKSDANKMTHHHYTKVVKTKFKLMDQIPPALRGHELFQYTASSHQYEDYTHVPSVKVSFDFSPMTLYFKEHGTPMYKFLTSVCAIVGGAITVFSMVNSVVQSSFK
jgi:thiol-disulfide isomerase/thioredoxin